MPNIRKHPKKFNCIGCGIEFAAKRSKPLEKYCSIDCYQASRNISYRKKINKVSCFRCGFIPEDICQLDIDHKDGNHKNNDVSNLQVLCANCHRLKSYITKQGYGFNKKNINATNGFKKKPKKK